VKIICLRIIVVLSPIWEKVPILEKRISIKKLNACINNLKNLIRAWQKDNVLLMDENNSGWDFVLISNPSSAKENWKSLWFMAFDRRRGQIL
jgi:hypothetical protein